MITRMCHCCYVLLFSAFVVLLLVETTLSVDFSQTPEYITPCKRSDPNLNECIKRGFNHLRPYMAKGIPEIDVPPLEPLVLPRVAVENGNGAVRVRASFNNLTIYGASNYTITKINADLERLRIDVDVTLPRIEASGKYEVSGNILLFPVRSKGEFWAAFYDIEGKGRVYAKEFTLQDGKRYMKTEKLLIDFRLAKSRFRVKDLINDGNVIGEAMNQFLNQNADEIIKETKPVVTQTISRYFREFLNAAFLKVPLDVWLLNE